MELDEKETKTALEGLYVGAKHNDSLAVAVWCKKLDEMGVGFRAQNYIFSEASRDFSPGIPSGKINVAFDIAKEQYAVRRTLVMAPEQIQSPLHIGDLFVSNKGVEAKVIEIKADNYYSGDMTQIRLEMMSGINQGLKVWYDQKTLQNLFRKKEPPSQNLNQDGVKTLAEAVFQVQKSNEKTKTMKV
ncbi:hypothetical protein [Sulfuricurvum sp.]|uniref:hypothetical protein n=1 Tax=Sulfuricurvum sp. TaxID=2025608 RepID=UPI0026059CE9|nr:hypothetical protein [Sulfuricurvum sp.]MDD3596674.1 hypothetical protein [Sulfuricurvum sp.]